MHSFYTSGCKFAFWILLTLAAAVPPAFASHGNSHPSTDHVYDIKPKQVKWIHQYFTSDLKDTPEEACAKQNEVSSQWGHWENSVPAYTEGTGCRADSYYQGQYTGNSWLSQIILAEMICPSGYQKLDDGNGPASNYYRLNNPYGTMECFKALSVYVTTAPTRNPEDLGNTCPKSGNPINPANGNKYQIEQDFTDSHAGDLSFERSYNSLARNGRHWTHRFDKALLIRRTQQLPPNPQTPLVKATANTSLYWACANWTGIRSNAETTAKRLSTASYNYTTGECELTYSGQIIGTLDLYTDNPADRLLAYEELIQVVRDHGKAITVRKVGGAWINPSDMPGSLTQDATGYTWKDKDDSVERYDLNGKLQTITYPSGLVHTLSYDTDGLLIGVEDSFGRELTFEYDANDRMSALIDPAGHRYEYEYDSNGMLNKVIYPDDTPGSSTDNPTRLYHYEDTSFPRALTGITDENGNRYATWSYDDYGRAVSSEHAGGVDEVDLSYNLDGTVTETNALGKQTIYHYGALVNNRRKITEIEGVAGVSCAAASKETTYDSNGYVNTKTDWNGNVTDYDYNSAGLETQRIEAYGTANARTITTTWHSTLRKPTLITEPGRTTAFTYDSTGNMLTRTITDTATSAARTTTWTYNSYGQVLTVNGPRTDVTDLTEYDYDTDGDLILITNALGHEIEFTSHDANGNPLTMVDANGVTTTFTYDARQRLTSYTVAHGTAAAATTAFEYWPTGKLKKVTQPDSSYLLYTYDNAQRLIQIEDNLGNTIAYTLDDAGNRTEEEVSDPADVLVRTQTAVYDGLSRLLDSIGASTQTTEYEYDNNGNVVEITDPRSHATGQTFDALNRLIEIVDPQNGATYPTEFTYDARDNLTSVEDPRGLVTQYQYNGFDEVTQLTSPDTGVTTYTYDAAGNKTSQTDAKSVTLNYSYDALNRLTSVDAPGAADDISYTYDTCTNGVGRLCGVTRGNVTVSYSYDVYGNIANVDQDIGTLSLDMDYVYNDDLHLESVTYPSGAVIDYAYDSAGRISSITLDEGLTSTTLIDTITYQPFGPVKGYVQDNGVIVSFDYDLGGRIEAITAGTIFDRDYAYDLAGNIEELDDAILNALDRSYSYDAINRLSLEENLAGTTTLFDYGYDRVGNRTLYDDTVTSQTLSYSGTSNRLTQIDSQSVTTDNNGNITSIHGMTLAYDAHNRLSSATVSSIVTNYAYNGLGERVTKTTGSSTGHYFYQGPNPIAEYDASGNVEREYVYLNGQPVVMLDHTGFGTDIYWIHNDHLGRPLALTDEAGDVVWRITSADAFGNATVIDEDPDNNSVDLVFNIRFPGQYFGAETGFHYNYFRDYDPRTGRYVESDPIGLGGGLNTYLYANGNSVLYIDDLGLRGHHPMITVIANIIRAIGNIGSRPMPPVPPPGGWPTHHPGTDIPIDVPIDVGEPVNFGPEAFTGSAADDKPEEDCPPNGKDCKKVTNQCIEECLDFIPDSDLQSMNFQKCLSDCKARNGCK